MTTVSYLGDMLNAVNASLTLDFIGADDVTGVKTTEALLDGAIVTNGQVIDVYTLALGNHTLMTKTVL